HLAWMTTLNENVVAITVGLGDHLLNRSMPVILFFADLLTLAFRDRRLKIHNKLAIAVDARRPLRTGNNKKECVPVAIIKSGKRTPLFPRVSCVVYDLPAQGSKANPPGRARSHVESPAPMAFTFQAESEKGSTHPGMADQLH